MRQIALKTTLKIPVDRKEISDRIVGESGQKGSVVTGQWSRVWCRGVRVQGPKTNPQSRANTNFEALVVVFASLAAIRKLNVSRKSPNPDRRKGPIKGSSRVQAGDRREIRTQILYHQSRREGCPVISLRGMGADRTEAGFALDLQPNQKEVSEPRELLRPGSRDGWAGQVVDSTVVTAIGGHQRRGCRHGQFDLPGSPQHRNAPDRNGRREVHD